MEFSKQLEELSIQNKTLIQNETESLQDQQIVEADDSASATPSANPDGITFGEEAAVKVLSKLKLSEENKEKGNQYFKQKEIRKALRSYHTALLYIRGVNQDLNPPSEAFSTAPIVDNDVPNKVNLLRASINNNIAACLLMQSPIPYDRVLECCEETIKYQPDNTKAWYRKAVALHGQHLTDRAKLACMRANRLADGRDAAIRKLMDSIDGEIKFEHDSFDKLFKHKLIKKHVC